LGFSFFKIEIAIGIGIDAVGRLILSNLVASSAETAEHRGHSVEFIQFLVSKRHISLIPIAIPISIWIIPTTEYTEGHGRNGYSQVQPSGQMVRMIMDEIEKPCLLIIGEVLKFHRTPHGHCEMTGRLNGNSATSLALNRGGGCWNHTIPPDMANEPWLKHPVRRYGKSPVKGSSQNKLGKFGAGIFSVFETRGGRIASYLTDEATKKTGKRTSQMVKLFCDEP
ncbi:MAG: hypothetical protein SWH68_12345, partial [Thermodesulfobacteriota bacterium]|nr:hypothetical protein [Thermodesulfobacteriota bacterium]